MNPLILVTILAVGATAQYSSYGSNDNIVVRVQEPSYQQQAPSYYAAPAPTQAPRAPAPAPSYNSYQQPASSGYGGYGSGSSSNSMSSGAQILRFDHNIVGGQSDRVDFETSNGIKSTFNTQVVPGRSTFTDENGQQVQSDSSLEQSGHSYHEVEGQHISLTWTADKNGFHPTGSHLPQPVEMPADHAQAHREALAIAAAHPPSAQSSSGSYGSSPSYGPSSSYGYSAPSAPAPQPQVVRQQSYGY